MAVDFHHVEFILGQVKQGTTFIGVDMRTVPELRGGKKNPHIGRVNKVCIGASVMVATNKWGSAYEAMVKRRLLQEGKNIAADAFEVKPRKWGVRIPESVFIEHNGQLYVELFFLSPGEILWELDGKVVDKSEIQGIPAPSTYEDQQGGLDRLVHIRSVKLDSLTRLAVNGKVYDL